MTTTTPGRIAAGDVAVLDNAAWESLSGPHAHFARGEGRVLGYPRDVSPLMAFPDDPTDAEWAVAADLVGPGGAVPFSGNAIPPTGWTVAGGFEGVQLVATSVSARAEGEAVTLTAHDVPDMLALVERTQPGPFLPRTIELGTYLGIRRDGRLIAMAGERLHPPGWTEISAVCTDADSRGEGLATRLVLAVAHNIVNRGDTPFMHANAANTNAIRLYESLGFTLRRRSTMTLVVPPGATP
ncbi:putative GNAT family acetyltransferase [Branchiibius hedensis]|uniref:Predicted acetyltransferase, GNAT family n=1 Tax=Branchiibius hedensis TaxID=672460 RepID=A0A2Y8ZRS5_9MICO|nr:GNAT family N-acetyltransferase [Branchiibius hedensis]PWJ26259.1 putative GNAT family acetyltransferase [Branchiibius hedensis]SSA35071.1 Predicted acetyltransferase, GNAT family [Branchiibius hedensis]